MKILLLTLFALEVFAQTNLQNPVTVLPGAGSATGSIRLRERRNQAGDNWVALTAPQSVAADLTFTLPGVDGTAGACIKTNGVGELSLGACSSGSEFLVTNYGALCNDAADDTAAIQAAINAATAASYGTVQFPRGICRVTTLNVATSYMGFQGTGRSESWLRGTTNAATIAVNTTVGALYAFEIRDMTLIGTGGTLSVGIDISGPNSFERSVFHNLYLTNYRRAIHLHTGAYHRWIHFEFNLCDVSSVTSGTCFDMQNVSGTGGTSGTISNNLIMGGYSTGYGIYLHDDFGDIVMNNNHFEGGLHAIYLDCSGVCSYGERVVMNGNKSDNSAVPFKWVNVRTSTALGNRTSGGVAVPITIDATSTGNIIDANYNNGVIMTNPSGSGIALNGYSSGFLRLGDLNENISNTTKGLSIKDAGAVVALGIGQSIARSVGLKWEYNATPANAYGVLYTYGASNGMYYQALFHQWETGGAGRWGLDVTGMMYPVAHDTYDIGLAGTRVRTVYAKGIDTALAGGTGDYVRTRKLDLFDNTGSASSPAFWDFNVVASGIGAFSESYLYLRDNGGAKVFQAERVRSGSAVDRTFWYTDLLPDTTLGQSLGTAAYKWQNIYANVLGSTVDPVTVFGGNSEFVAIATPVLTLNTGAATVGYVWTATSTGGAGSWQVAGGLPVIDTTGIAKGSVTATKIVRFEVDGFTAGAIRVLTPPDADITLAGINIAQIFSGANTFSVGQTFSGTNAYNANQTYSGDIRFGADNTYNIGVTGTRPTHIYTRNFSMSASGYVSTGGTLNIQSGGTLDINTGGTLSSNGSAGLSVTKTVRASGGAADCTLIYSSGILTGGTC